MKNKAAVLYTVLAMIPVIIGVTGLFTYGSKANWSMASPIELALLSLVACTLGISLLQFARSLEVD